MTINNSQNQQSDSLPIGEHIAHRRIIRNMLVLMPIQAVFLVLEQQWLAFFLVMLLIVTMLAPILFKRKMDMEIPAEFHLIAVLFTFAALYLGEVRSFYERFWWWDIALHTSAGFLMGILGFLLVYLLNESRRIDLHLAAGFIAFFAFLFSITIGTVWEIFEFSMDRFFSTICKSPCLEIHPD